MGLPLCSFRWLGTAGFELRLGATNILIDPYLSRTPEARPSLALGPADVRADAVFLTHGHFDHAYDVPEIALRSGAPVFGSSSVCAAMHDLGVSARQLHVLPDWRTCQLGEVTVLGIPSGHVRFDLPLAWRAARRAGLGNLFRFGRKAAGQPCGNVLGYQFAIRGHKALHFGSAGWQQAALAKLQPDVAMIPLQGHSDIYQRAAHLVELLHPKRVIPHHHDSFFPPISEQVDVEPFFRMLHRDMPDVVAVEPRIGQWMPLF